MKVPLTPYRKGKMNNISTYDDIIETSPYFWKNLKEIEEKWSSHTKDLDQRNKTVLSIILENIDKFAYREELKEENKQYYIDLKELIFKDVSFNYRYNFNLKNYIGIQPITNHHSFIYCNDNITSVSCTTYKSNSVRFHSRCS
jgi:hypothetical protein